MKIWFVGVTCVMILKESASEDKFFFFFFLVVRENGFIVRILIFIFINNGSIPPINIVLTELYVRI